MKNITKIGIAFCLFIAGNNYAQKTKIISGFNHVESVAADGKFIYAADIGKELNPTVKDGDGKIFKLDKKGQIVDANFVNEKLDAPKGLAINKGVLYINDVDRLLAINIKTGDKLFEIDFSKDASFLNDIAVWDNKTLYVSATDKNKLFKVNLVDKSYSEIKTDKTIYGINGLFCHKKASRIYVNGFGSDNKPNGIIGYINLKDNSFTRITNLEGYYDGIFISKDVLYVSNWVAFEKKGIIQGIGIYGSNRFTTINKIELIAGPADFIIVNDQLIVPAMMTGEIHFIKLESDLSLKL
jgi:DNA-binding beta-propeller fold protein YncE